MTSLCEWCRKPYGTIKKEQRFCSKICFSFYRRSINFVACLNCGVMFHKRRPSSIYCSRSCLGTHIVWEINGECWNVTSHSIGSHGYPVIYRDGNGTTVVRYIYQELFGLLESDIFVRHKCDNRLCINPEHLESGTHLENIQDMMDRGRDSKGETSGLNKLNNKQVFDIKQSFANGESVATIAKKYPIVSKSNIRLIVKNEAWKHITI